jgi:CRP-like cAMP-binding protein
VRATRVREGVAETKAAWYLRKIPFFAGVDAEAMNRMLAAVEVRETKSRQVVYLPGDPGNSVFFIVGGRVKRAKVTREGKELTIAYHGAGDMFGELCLVDGGAPRDEMAEATRNTIIAELPAHSLRALVSSNARLTCELAAVLIVRRREIEAKLQNILFRGVSSKLAELLIELADEYGFECAGTHLEMAALIGSTRETVSLTLAQFRKQGALDNVGRTFVIKDPAVLRGLV